VNALLAAAVLYCSASTSAAWSHGWNLQVLPVKPCIMQSDTGAYRCSRKEGCNKCGPYACPELGIKGPQT
jgi:hypothetical protein